MITNSKKIIGILIKSLFLSILVYIVLYFTFSNNNFFSVQFITDTLKTKKIYISKINNYYCLIDQNRNIYKLTNEQQHLQDLDNDLFTTIKEYFQNDQLNWNVSDLNTITSELSDRINYNLIDKVNYKLSASFINYNESCTFNNKKFNFVINNPGNYQSIDLKLSDDKKCPVIVKIQSAFIDKYCSNNQFNCSEIIRSLNCSNRTIESNCLELIRDISNCTDMVNILFSELRFYCKDSVNMENINCSDFNEATQCSDWLKSVFIRGQLTTQAIQMETIRVWNINAYGFELFFKEKRPERTIPSFINWLKLLPEHLFSIFPYAINTIILTSLAFISTFFFAVLRSASYCSHILEKQYDIEKKDEPEKNRFYLLNVLSYIFIPSFLLAYLSLGLIQSFHPFAKYLWAIGVLMIGDATFGGIYHQVQNIMKNELQKPYIIALLSYNFPRKSETKLQAIWDTIFWIQHRPSIIRRVTRNAITSILPIFNNRMVFMLSGSIVVEVIFHIHGLSYYCTESIGSIDQIPKLLTLVFFCSIYSQTINIVIELATDLLNVNK